MRDQVIEKPSSWKIAILVAAPVALCAVWWWNGRHERSWDQEAINSVAGVVYRVQCSECQKQFEMPSEEYINKFEAVGVACQFCDSRSAVKVGEAGDDPEQFKEELARLTTVSDVQNALEATEAEYEEVLRQIEELGDLNSDPERGPKLRRERARLWAKIQALNMRWSEILSS